MKPWWVRLAAFAPRHWRGLLGIGLMLLATSALNALKPWPMKLLVDHVFSERPFPSGLSWLELLPGGDSAAGLCGWLAASTLVIFALAWAIQTIQAYIQSGVALRITHALGAQVFQHLQRLSLRFHSKQPTGDLVRRVTRDSRCARDLILNVLMPVLRSSVTLVIMLVIMFQMDVLLTTVALLIAPGVVLARKLFYPTMMRCSYDQQQWEGRMMSQAERALTAIPVIQAFGQEDAEALRFRETANETLRAYFRALAAQMKFRIWTGGSTTLCRVSVMMIGGYRVLEGDLTVGGLLVFLAYLGNLYQPLNAVGGQLTAGMAKAEASALRVFEILDSGDLISESSRKTSAHREPDQWKGRVTFDQVGFAYEPGSPVLQEINLDVKPGECIAFVGATGAGKSTLVSLLLRFFDPCQGRILVDGVDIRDVALSTLRDQIAILLQDPFLLPVSVAENIAYGRAEATREEIVAAATAANADTFIRRLLNGYDTTVGERGATLSGGQRQRIAIARAMLKDASILILDEPTSALDVHTEQRLMATVRNVFEGRTVIIIAHRLSTIRAADRIVVLREGRLVETGTHDELRKLGGAYSELWMAHENPRREMALEAGVPFHVTKSK